MIKKSLIIISTLLIAIVFSVSQTFAHVVVRPNQVGVASFQTFTVGVPNEKDKPTTALKLMIPEGLHHVSPNVKPGWTITVNKTGEGEEATVTEISWTGGSIPAGQRDDFLFSAQVPPEEAKLVWKAYQTYADGTVVSWDQESDTDASDNTGPFSMTKVINDLKSSADDEHAVAGHDTGTDTMEGKTDESDKIPLVLSVVAILLAGGSLWMGLGKR